MGAFCPTCQLRKEIVENITAKGGAVSKDNPVLARRLSCGHTVGGAGYAAFQAKIAEIDAEAFNAKRKLDEQAVKLKAAAWAAIADGEED
jgi:hypothetical protein